MASRQFSSLQVKLAGGRMGRNLSGAFRAKPQTRTGTILNASQIDVGGVAYEFRNTTGADVAVGATLTVENVGRPAAAVWAPAQGVGGRVSGGSGGGGGGGGSGGDHGSLSGLQDDDHPQYLTAARGNLLYYSQSQVDALFANVAYTNVANTFTAAQTFGTGASGGHVSIKSPAAGTVGLVVDTAASPTAAAQEWRRNGSAFADMSVSGANRALRMLDFDNGTDKGPFIELKRNNNAGTPAAGFLALSDKSGDVHRLWVDDTGSLRIWDAGNPTNANDTAGIVVGSERHDGTGGFLFVTKTAVDGTAQTIIPNGTGDVTASARYLSVVQPSSGLPQTNEGALTPGGVDAQIYDDGGTNTLALRCNADGSVDVRRTAGSLTYTVALYLIWL